MSVNDNCLLTVQAKTSRLSMSPQFFLMSYIQLANLVNSAFRLYPESNYFTSTFILYPKPSPLLSDCCSGLLLKSPPTGLLPVYSPHTGADGIIYNSIHLAGQLGSGLHRAVGQLRWLNPLLHTLSHYPGGSNTGFFHGGFSIPRSKGMKDPHTQVLFQTSILESLLLVIHWLKQVMLPSPDSRDGELDSTF